MCCFCKCSALTAEVDIIVTKDDLFLIVIFCVPITDVNDVFGDGKMNFVVNESGTSE